MNAFVHHFSFEFRSGIRHKQLLLMNYLFPLGFYLMMGVVMAEINPPFRENIIPAMIVFGVLAATLLGIPDPLVNARENGVFRSYKINGIPSTSILIIPAMTTALHMSIVAAIITATGSLLFEAPLPVNWFNFVLVFLALAFACAGLSILIGVVSPSSHVLCQIRGGMSKEHSHPCSFADVEQTLCSSWHGQKEIFQPNRKYQWALSV